MATLSLIVDWYGPFSSIESASVAAVEMEFGQALYMASGKRRYQRMGGLQYVGITKNPSQRLVDHHKLGQVTSNLKIWWGEVTSHAVAGRHGKKHPVRHSMTLTTAELMLAYFLALPLNDRLRRSPPKRSVVLLSRWFSPEGKRRSHRGESKWPDMIELDREGDEPMALRLWFGTPGKRDRLSPADIEELAGS